MTRNEQSASVLWMAAPLVVSFWMRAAVTFVDTIFASFIGDASVAAIGLTVPLEFLMIAAWVGLSTGLTARLASAMGAHEGRRVAQYIDVGRRLAFSLAPLFAVIGLLIWPLAPRLGLESDTARALQIYGTVLVGGSAFTTFWSILPDSLVKAHQDTRSTMWAGIWSNVINLGLNTLFLFVFHWDVFGIALSTVLGRIGGLGYAQARAAHHERLRLGRDEEVDGSPDPTPYRSILRLAIPSSLTFGLMAGEAAVINGLLATVQHATAAIAAYAIYYRIVLFAIQPVIATAVALLPFSARLHGKRDCAGIRRGLRHSGIATGIYALLVVGPFALLAAPWIARELAETPQTLQYTEFAIRLAPLACLTGAPFLLARPVFEAMQQGRPGLIMALVRYLVLTAPFAWLGMVAADRWGQPALYGLLVGTLLAAAISSAAFYVWLRSLLREFEREC